MSPWQYLPYPWRQALGALPEAWSAELEEVRFRVGQPVRLYGPTWCRALPELGGDIVMTPDLSRILDALVEHSLYARVEELRQGFITLPGGHRVGVAGRAVWRNGAIETMRNIRGLNFRVARAVVGVGLSLERQLVDGGVRGRSILIVSPPRAGKTTLLRDLVRIWSNAGLRTVVVDERSEIAGLGGVGGDGYDLGEHSDVLDGWPKPEGMDIALRTLGPDLIAVDELGGGRDIEALSHARYAGVDVLATVHARQWDDLVAKPRLMAMIEQGAFDAVVLLSRRLGPGTAESLWIRGTRTWPLVS